MSRRIGISRTISKGRRRRVMTLGLKQVLLRALHSERETVTEVCRKIYGFNEVMFEERRSASYLADLLERRGFRVERGAAGLETAFARVLIDRLGEAEAKKTILEVIRDYSLHSAEARKKGMVDLPRRGIHKKSEMVNPLSHQDLRDKFLTCCSLSPWLVFKHRTDQLIEIVETLEEAGSVTELINALSSRG